MRTGIDLVEISRIERSMKNSRFMSRIFSPSEQKFLMTHGMKAQSVAANFCAKEAFVKALGTGFTQGIKLNEISVLRDYMGAPYIMATGRAKELLDRSGYPKISVSLTHTKDNAAAVVILFK